MRIFLHFCFLLFISCKQEYILITLCSLLLYVVFLFWLLILCILFCILQILFIKVNSERKFSMEHIRQLNPFYKMMSVAVIIFLISGIFRLFGKTEITNRSRLIHRKAHKALRSRRYSRRLRTEDYLTPRSRDTSEKRQKKLFSDFRSSRGLRRRELPIMQH